MRKKLTDRQRILNESGVAGESVVLEVGAGNGYFTEALAEHAKKVIVIEIQEGMVKKLKKRISGLADKVDIIKADISAYGVREAFADVCLLYYCFHEFSNKPDAVRNISRSVRSGGILSIYEPRVEVRKKDMIRTVRLFTNAGFEKEMEHNKMFTWFVRLKKTGQ